MTDRGEVKKVSSDVYSSEWRFNIMFALKEVPFLN